jgi:hypothetical protein
VDQGLHVAALSIEGVNRVEGTLVCKQRLYLSKQCGLGLTFFLYCKSVI